MLDEFKNSNGVLSVFNKVLIVICLDMRLGAMMAQMHSLPSRRSIVTILRQVRDSEITQRKPILQFGNR